MFLVACSSAAPGSPGERAPDLAATSQPSPASAPGSPPSPAPAVSPTPAEPEARPLVWVAVENGNAIAEVNVRTGKVLRTFQATGGPHNITVAGDGLVAASLYGSDAILVIREGKARRLELGGRPHDVKFAEDLLVVTNEAARRLDLVADGKRVAWRRSLKAEPHDVAINPKSLRAWVSLNGTDDLAVVDLSDRSVRYASTGRRPHDLLFAPNRWLWVTDWGGALHLLNRKGKVVESIPLGVEAHHLAFTPNGRRAWITDHAAERVSVLSVGTLEVVASIPVSGAPHHVAITADGRWAVVADHDHGTLLVFRERTHKLVRTIDVGPGPHGVWAVPAGA